MSEPSTANELVSKAELAALRADAERVNRMLRDTGYGQGAIDAYVAQCEEIDRLRADAERWQQCYRRAVDDNEFDPSGDKFFIIGFNVPLSDIGPPAQDSEKFLAAVDAAIAAEKGAGDV